MQFLYITKDTHPLLLLLLLLLLPLAIQPNVGSGQSNNILSFFPIYRQLCPSCHSQHLKISFYFLSPFSPGSSLLVPSSSWAKIFLGILSSSILSRWPNQITLCPFTPFTIFTPLLFSSSSRFVLLFHSPFSYLGPYILLNIFLSKTRTACSYFFSIAYAAAPYDTIVSPPIEMFHKPSIPTGVLPTICL